jgi:hypothetical protein
VTADLWLDDIARLRRVAEVHLLAVGTDLDTCLRIVAGLTAGAGAFGDLPGSAALAARYEHLRAFLEQNTRTAGDRVHGVGVGLRVIADTYADAESKNELTP